MTDVGDIEYFEVVRGYRDSIVEVIDEDVRRDLTFVPQTVISVSSNTLKGWRKVPTTPNTSMTLIDCRIGAKENLLFVFTATSDEGEVYECEVGLTVAESSIDGFKDALMMALNLNAPLSNTIKTYWLDDKKAAKEKTLFAKAKAISDREERREASIASNSLFGSW